MIGASIKSRIYGTRRKDSVVPVEVASQPKHSACWRTALREGESENRSFGHSTSASEVRACIKRPALGVLTTSGVPHMFVATTGVPQAIDSNNTLAQPSRLEQSTKASAALYHHLSCSFGTWPTKRTLFARPFPSASTFSGSRSGPVPAITRIEFFGRAEKGLYCQVMPFAFDKVTNRQKNAFIAQS